MKSVDQPMYNVSVLLADCEHSPADETSKHYVFSMVVTRLNDDFVTTVSHRFRELTEKNINNCCKLLSTEIPEINFYSFDIWLWEEKNYDSFATIIESAMPDITLVGGSVVFHTDLQIANNFGTNYRRYKRGFDLEIISPKR